MREWGRHEGMGEWGDGGMGECEGAGAKGTFLLFFLFYFPFKRKPEGVRSNCVMDIVVLFL